MSMANRDGFIWMDGKMVPWRDANIHVLTHTLHYGMGVFEGFGAAQDIVDFLALEVHFVLELGLNAVDVRAGAAEETEVVHGLLRE